MDIFENVDKPYNQSYDSIQASGKMPFRPNLKPTRPKTMTREFKRGHYVDVANPEQLTKLWGRPAPLPDFISPLQGRGPYRITGTIEPHVLGGLELILEGVDFTVCSRYFVIVPAPPGAGDEDKDL